MAEIETDEHLTKKIADIRISEKMEKRSTPMQVGLGSFERASSMGRPRRSVHRPAGQRAPPAGEERVAGDRKSESLYARGITAAAWQDVLEVAHVRKHLAMASRWLLCPERATQRARPRGPTCIGVERFSRS